MATGETRRWSFRVLKMPALLFLLSASASAQDYEKIALLGETAPGTGGGTYSDFSLAVPSIGDAGGVAFVSDVTGGTVSTGIFKVEGGAHAAVAFPGDATPGGGTYLTVRSPAINSSGDVAFYAEVAGGLPPNDGVFVDSGGTDSAIARSGDPAPGTGGGTYQTLLLAVPAINDSGDVLFYAFVTGGTVTEGIFVVDSGGIHSAVALPGDPAPGTGGGTYSSFFNGIPSFNDSGDVVFAADVTGGTVTQGIFVASGGTDTAIALLGQMAPGTGGGTFDVFDRDPSINESGGVAFVGRAMGGTVDFGVFSNAGGTLEAVSLEGDAAPGAGGAGYLSFNQAWITSAGDVVFLARPSGAFSNLFYLDSGGNDSLVLVLGDTAPETGGGTFAGLDLPSSRPVNADGKVAFRASVAGGAVGQGVFTAVPSIPVPALRAPGLAVAFLVLGIAVAFAASGLGKARRLRYSP